MSTGEDKLICVAAIIGAFGVRGELRVKSFTGEPEDFSRYGPLRDQAGQIILTPISARSIKKGLALRAKEITTPEQAEALKSTQLFVYRSSLPAADEDEFYITDLLGMTAQDKEGKILGKVKAVQDFGAGDVLEIQPPSGPSWYHPFTLAAVPQIDMAARTLTIELIESLPDERGDATQSKAAS